MNSQLDIELPYRPRAASGSGEAAIARSRLAFSHPHALEERLWEEFTSRSADTEVASATVLLLGFDGSELSVMRNLMRAAGVASCRYCSDVLRLGDSAMTGAFTHLVVNLDGFGTNQEAVTRLLDFRLKQKSTVVLLVSGDVGADDLGSDRKWLCDATLKMPLSMTRLREGLFAAARTAEERAAL